MVCARDRQWQFERRHSRRRGYPANRRARFHVRRQTSATRTDNAARGRLRAFHQQAPARLHSTPSLPDAAPGKQHHYFRRQRDPPIGRLNFGHRGRIIWTMPAAPDWHASPCSERTPPQNRSAQRTLERQNYGVPGAATREVSTLRKHKKKAARSLARLPGSGCFDQVHVRGDQPAGPSANTSRPNASGTWKFGWAYSSAARRNKSAAPPRLPLEKNSLATPQMDRNAASSSSSAAPAPLAIAYCLFIHIHAPAKPASQIMFFARGNLADRSKIHLAPPRILCSGSVATASAAETLRKRRDPKADPGGPFDSASGKTVMLRYRASNRKNKYSGFHSIRTSVSRCGSAFLPLPICAEAHRRRRLPSRVRRKSLRIHRANESHRNTPYLSRVSHMAVASDVATNRCVASRQSCPVDYA